MANPLNFSQSAINRGAEIFARYQNQCRMSQQLDSKGDECSTTTSSNIDENGNKKNMLNIENQNKKAKTTDMRKIDKIAENLRSASNSAGKSSGLVAEHKPAVSTQSQSPSPMMLKSPPFGNLSHRFTAMTPEDISVKGPIDCPMGIREHQQHPPSPFLPGDQSMIETAISTAASNLSTTPKPSNSKIYATCFICHKQLSNQYNLRVHLETHQNVR